MLLVVALSVGTGSFAVTAEPAPQSGPRSLAVSVPAEPTALVLGAVSVIPVRILNPGAAPVSVTVTDGAVQFGDEGALTVAAEPDPDWQGLVDFPPGPLTVPAGGYVDVPLTVRVPAQLSPDLYFVGFLVTPLATGVGNVKVINQIGSYVTLDVPGPRDRELSASLDGSHFALRWHGEKTLRVRNVGHAAVRFWGENDTTSFPGGGTPQQQRIDKSLLPVGHVRSFTVTGKPAWPIGLVTMKVHVLYPGRTEDSTQEIVLTKRVLVVNPIALAALLILVGVAIRFWFIRRRRRRRRAAAELPRAFDRPAATATPPSAPPIPDVVASSIPQSEPFVQAPIKGSGPRPASYFTRPTERVIDLASGRVADRAATADGSDLPAFLLRQLQHHAAPTAVTPSLFRPRSGGTGKRVAV